MENMDLEKETEIKKADAPVERIVHVPEYDINGKRGLRWGFAVLYTITYFGFMAFTFIGGISSEHIILAMVLYVVSAMFWTSEFFYLIKAKPFILLMLALEGGGKKWAIIWAHITMLVLSYGLLAFQFLLR